jgi:hypothetical protein
MMVQLGKVAGKIKSILEFVKTEINKHKVVKKAKVSQLLKWKFHLLSPLFFIFRVIYCRKYSKCLRQELLCFRKMIYHI